MMIAAAKILRFGSLLCAVFLVLSQVCPAQNPLRPRRMPVQQQPNPGLSTAEQEAQPNTANYPQAPVNTNPVPNPNVVATPANSSQIPQTPNTAVKTPTVPNAAQTSRAPVAAPNRPMVPQSQVLIGPPAPIPPTPEQMPPSAPKVTYQNGLLSVESVNSRLIDILSGIRNKTGMQF